MSILAAGLDSAEAAFSINILGMTESEYGWMISISGAGFVIGSIINSLIVEKLNLKQLILFGGIVYVTGYLTFTLAFNYLMACIGVFTISFALAYINTGFITFIQLVFPANRIGQLTATLSIFNSIMEMGIVAIVSGFGSIYNIRRVLLMTEFLMLFIVMAIFRYSGQLQLDNLEKNYLPQTDTE